MVVYHWGCFNFLFSRQRVYPDSESYQPRCHWASCWIILPNAFICMLMIIMFFYCSLMATTIHNLLHLFLHTTLTIFLLSFSFLLRNGLGWTVDDCNGIFCYCTWCGLFVFKEVPFDAVEDDIAQSWFPDSPELFSNEYSAETVVSADVPILLAVPHGTTLPSETVLCHPITGMNGMHSFTYSCTSWVAHIKYLDVYTLDILNDFAITTCRTENKQSHSRIGYLQWSSNRFNYLRLVRGKCKYHRLHVGRTCTND